MNIQFSLNVWSIEYMYTFGSMYSSFWISEVLIPFPSTAYPCNALLSYPHSKLRGHKWLRQAPSVTHYFVLYAVINALSLSLLALLLAHPSIPLYATKRAPLRISNSCPSIEKASTDWCSINYFLASHCIQYRLLSPCVFLTTDISHLPRQSWPCSRNYSAPTPGRRFQTVYLPA